MTQELYSWAFIPEKKAFCVYTKICRKMFMVGLFLIAKKKKKKKIELKGFPGGAVVENPPVNAGDTGSSPGPGRSHMPRSN